MKHRNKDANLHAACHERMSFKTGVGKCPLVNVQIKHHRTSGDVISNQFEGDVQIPKKGHLPTPVEPDTDTTNKWRPEARHGWNTIGKSTNRGCPLVGHCTPRICLVGLRMFASSQINGKTCHNWTFRLEEHATNFDTNSVQNVPVSELRGSINSSYFFQVPAIWNQLLKKLGWFLGSYFPFGINFFHRFNWS